MLHHELDQGSPEWHAYRATKFNASDAPAMLGLSKYKSRNDLLLELKTGLTADIDSATQKRFDDGHRFEALARPVAERIVKGDLYPVTGSNGIYSASFDGLTMSEDIAFEHKTLNDAIRACNSADDLAEMYLVQMEQQLLVSGAEKCLFMATTWNGADELIEEKHFWYEPNAERRQRIIDGWAQFKIDLDNYVPIQVIEKPKAHAIEDLPALFIHARGEITTSNLKEYGEALAIRLAHVRSIALVSDQDFSNAKEAAKNLRNGIEQAKLAKAAMLSQTATVGETASLIDAWCEDMRLTALQLEKNVEREDKAKKLVMINEAQGEFTSVIQYLEDKVRPIRLNISMPNFGDAIKGKSKFSSMQDAIDTLLANSTAQAKRIQLEISEKQEYIGVVAEGYDFLFADLQQIIFKADDDFKLLVNTRIKTHREAEAEREAQIKAQAREEQIKLHAEMEARAKVQAEAAAKVEAKAVQPSNHFVESNKMPTGLPPQLEAEFGKHFQAPKLVRSEVTPSASDLVQTIARAYGVDDQVAHLWLINTDFATMMQKAA